ncbi:MAG: helix-turn-helix domain-containing protein [Clostridia bacterium]|nr:helix-turn-helix domain-containing protein [Clostridia bacterium]
MNLGEKINELRKKHQMTQEMLAERLCVSPQAVSKWERGVANPDLELIPALAEIFQVSADEILGLSIRGKGAQRGNEPLEQRVAYLEKLIEILLVGDEQSALAIALRDAHPLIRFDFTEMTREEKSEWVVRNGEILDTASRYIFRATPCERPKGSPFWDPQILNDRLELGLEGIHRIRVRLRTQSGESTAKLQIFFRTKEHPHWTHRKHFSYRYATGSTAEAEISVSHSAWYGTLLGLRIDPTETCAQRCEVEWIELLNTKGEAVYRHQFSQKDAEGKGDWQLRHADPLPSENSLACMPILRQRSRITYDPILSLDSLNLPLGKAKCVHIRLRTDFDNPEVGGWYIDDRFYNSYLHLYFKTEASDSYSGQKKVRVDYVGGSGMVDVYADMSKNGFWNGRLTGIRLDPIEGAEGAKFEVELIEILDNMTNISSVGVLDGVKKRLKDMEDTVEDLESRADELECQVDELRCSIEESNEE